MTRKPTSAPARIGTPWMSRNTVSATANSSHITAPTRAGAGPRRSSQATIPPSSPRAAVPRSTVDDCAVSGIAPPQPASNRDRAHPASLEAMNPIEPYDDPDGGYLVVRAAYGSPPRSEPPPTTPAGRRRESAGVRAL